MGLSEKGIGGWPLATGHWGREREERPPPSLRDTSPGSPGEAEEKVDLRAGLWSGFFGYLLLGTYFFGVFTLGGHVDEDPVAVFCCGGGEFWVSCGVEDDVALLVFEWWEAF